MKFLSALLLFFFTSQLFAADLSPGPVDPASCPDLLVAYENLQIQQTLSSDGQKCYLGIHPRDAFETLIYRDYLVTSDGLLMVFNSFAPDDRPENAGAREYYFFPRKFNGFQWKVHSESLVLVGFSGLELRFSIKTAQLEAISGAKIQVADKVIPANRGGVEILSFNGLFMDAGFLTGNSPSSRPNAYSTWKNTQAEKCKLRNNQVFNYQGEDANLKPEPEITKMIQNKCPQFKL